jgi:hypothetical protein
MTQVTVVHEPAPDPKVGRERQVSGFNVPYFNLNDSIEVARVVRENGGRVNREQLAGLLKYKSTTSGTFKTCVSAAKAFGTIDQPEPNSDAIIITKRGTAIVAPVSEAEETQAKLDAFMAIPLFKLIYDEYRGRELPADVGLANLFENTHKMLKSRAMPAVKVMMASAETAGLFKINGVASRKMVLPLVANSTQHTPNGNPPTGRDIGPEPRRERDHGGGNGNGGGEIPGQVNPAFLALLSGLPAPGTTLSKVRRQQLVDAFTGIVGWVYPEPDEG